MAKIETVPEVLQAIEDRVRRTTRGGLTRREYWDRIAEALGWGPHAVRYSTETRGLDHRSRVVSGVDGRGGYLDEERRLRRALLPPRGSR